MERDISRRVFTLALPAGVAVLAASARGADATAAAGSDAASGTGVAEWFPRLDPAVIEKVVGLSHRDLAGVKEIVDARPVLANAAIDWGFGDWETALGAASHTGRREIAEYLISMGARSDLFTYAMLGDLATVKAMCEAYPAHRRISGPHGISLLTHARAGGEAAKAVVEYLTALGDADAKAVDVAFPESERKALHGAYRFGPGERDVIEVGEGMGGVTLKRTGSPARRLFRQADGSFHPAGSARVRVVFDSGAVGGAKVTVTDHELRVVGKR